MGNRNGGYKEPGKGDSYTPPSSFPGRKDEGGLNSDKDNGEYLYREPNGRWISPPEYDSYGDESSA